MTQEHAGVTHFLPETESAPLRQEWPGESRSLGASVRALREARGWGLGDVSARLKFAVKQIEALEDDRWEDLPRGPSLRGLVRNYARLLDVDPETLMSALPEHLKHHGSSVQGSLAPVGALPRDTLPRWSGDARRRRVWPILLLVLFLVCALALAAYLVFAWWLPRNAESAAAPETLGFPLALDQKVVPAEPVEPPQSLGPALAVAPVQAPGVEASVAQPGTAAGVQGAPASAAAPAPIAPVSAPQVSAAVIAGAAASTAAAATGGSTAGAPAVGAVPIVDPAASTVRRVGNEMVFTVTSASWIEVRDASGSVVLSTTLEPGASPRLEVNPPARVVIGNAGGVSLSWQGAAVDLAPHQRGNVARLTLE